MFCLSMSHTFPCSPFLPLLPMCALFTQNFGCIRLAIALATASSFTSSAASQAGTSEFNQGGCRREGDSESSHHIARPHTADRLAVHVHVDEKSKSMHVAEFIRDALGSYVQEYRVESADAIQDQKSPLLPIDAIPAEVLRRFGRGGDRGVQESAREVPTNQLSSIVDLRSNADPDSYAATPNRAHPHRVTDGVGAKAGAESSAGHTAATNSSATRGTFLLCPAACSRRSERAKKLALHRKDLGALTHAVSLSCPQARMQRIVPGCWP